MDIPQCKQSNRVDTSQRKTLSIRAMPQYKIVYPSQQPFRRIMPSVRQQTNQSLLLVPKMETSQHNPYESESLGSMNMNEVAMPQYKPSKVSMLQDKSKSIANERAMSQHVSS